MKWWKRLLIIPPILIGLVIVVLAARHARVPQHKPPQEYARHLEVIAAPAVEVVPQVVGYGTARPAKVWTAMIEVPGRIIEMHPKLRAGAFLEKDDVALRVDPREYQLAVDQLQAELIEVAARLEELDTQMTNDRASLEIEQEALAVVESEYERIAGLAERGTASPTEPRDAKLLYLAQKQVVQNLENSLRLNKRKRETFLATRKVTEARLAQQQLDLERTTIRAPFDCRLQNVNLELNQFVQPNQQLFVADGIDVTEIDVQIPFGQARNIVLGRDFNIEAVADLDRLRDSLELSAVVRLHGTAMDAQWPARFVRLREQLDPVTRTLQFVVAVDKPYQKIKPGIRPPLVRGTYCEVELRAKALAPHVVVPRSCLYDGAVYIVEADSRLRRRDVTVLFEQGDFACIGSGMIADELLVISDPRPAIDGQLVAPQSSAKVRSELIRQATGKKNII